MVEEKINEKIKENLGKDKMMGAFLNVGYKTCTSAKYFSYTIKRISKVIRLVKGSRNIAEWDIEKDNITVFDKLSTSEKSIANKFSKLPGMAEQLYKEQINKSDDDGKKPDKYTKLKEEIKQAVNNIQDTQVTKEGLTQIINQLADKYVYSLEGDCSADHYNDNYMNYIMQTRYTIESIMINIGDERISNILAKPQNKVYWDRYSDKQLSNMIKIIPLNAQREGNLFTITDKQHIVFERYCDEAYRYVKEHIMKQPLRPLVPEAIIEVCWWENNMEGDKFLIPSLQVEKTPNTYREVVLERLQPKPRKGANPSRLNLKIFFEESDKEGNVLPLLKKWISQPGVIVWNARL